MFHKASVRLAGLYLLIIMGISLFFSANVYQLSVQEFDHGLRGPGDLVIQQLPEAGFGTVRTNFIQARDQDFAMAKQRVLGRLIFINLLILIGGGFLSYFLALLTLKPIEEAHASLERFTADASHELRTPITAMRSENEVALMDSKLTLKQAKEHLKSNIEELEKLTHLTEGLLRLASLEKTQFNVAKLNSDEVVQQAISRVLSMAEQKKILISSDSAPVSFVGDESSLVEALVILLDNAVKYSPAKSEVAVSVKNEPRHTVLQVTDQGVGIKAGEAQHIFERFYRADTSRSKIDTNGYGLGLAIARDIVKLHHGSLTVNSKPGKGSTFTITLPH